MSRDTDADVLLITALPIERDAVIKFLESPQEQTFKGRIHHRGRIGPYDVIVLPMFGVGNVRAAAAVTDAIAVWNPAQIILVGIAGGVAKGDERSLGDVLVGEHVVDYELAKDKPDGMQRRYRG